MIECVTCKLISQRDEGVAPLWDNIFRTSHWDVVHSYNTAVPGWLVLVARRHIEAVDEMNREEAAELGALLQKASLALKRVTGCHKTYVMQFAEHPQHPHVHFHVVPRMVDQPEAQQGARIMAYLGVPENERVGEAAMNEIGVQVRRLLQTSDF